MVRCDSQVEFNWCTVLSTVYNLGLSSYLAVLVDLAKFRLDINMKTPSHTPSRKRLIKGWLTISLMYFSASCVPVRPTRALTSDNPRVINVCAHKTINEPLFSYPPKMYIAWVLPTSPTWVSFCTLWRWMQATSLWISPALPSWRQEVEVRAGKAFASEGDTRYWPLHTLRNTLSPLAGWNLLYQ